MTVTEKAFAKLNLWLEIYGKRADGYHEVFTVMQSVSLYDTVSVTPSGNGIITLECSDKTIPTGYDNLCVRAAKAYYDALNQKCRGIHIELFKRIPAGAGMGGGSSDAAAVLRALDLIEGERLGYDRLADIAEKIGADVPFCVYGGLRAASGTGSETKALDFDIDAVFVISKTNDMSSTVRAYSLIDAVDYSPKAPDDFFKALSGNNVSEWGRRMFNRFEDAVCADEKLKKILNANNAEGVLMTGSGSAVFGVFKNTDDAEKACAQLTENGFFSCVAYPENKYNTND